MIVWDEKKRLINLKKHGLDFKDAYLVHDNPDKVTFLSPRNNEDRRLDVAMVELAGRVLSLIYTHRSEDIRIISFRVASRKERKAYEEQQKLN
ncbi:MAG TPA: BrnT family toxin [Acidobacteriaceae bacterium]|nr:BrnT family toxin [Acidobacteriaceae bacterium]